ncbi:hypothetical protein B1219_18275 [Pseudomonas ogarae]|uniref:PaaI family thioesterase n=1 Tax=Pseudomonas ogarae (strain DSM 112162 / CECT 30235 / F113) TaxID=1114970 RepID=UPI0009A3D4C8|nr:PaaI family thioesterase [Pseudomonas ogarae]OPG72105.1 hypothetical protein B1219_18275 [Pseudomonas ogarae]
MASIDELRNRSVDCLPGTMGIEVVELSPERVVVEMAVKRSLMAPNGYLHAGSVTALADTAAGYGCEALLPHEAVNFTTIELKVNFLGTAREGVLVCISTPSHVGRTTQIWDSVVSVKETGKRIALFRCTQMLIYKKG